MVPLYESKIERVGPLVGELFERADLMVFFGSNAPPELWDISVLHGHPGYNGRLERGAVLTVADQKFTIVSVGDLALKNFRELGHLVLRFSESESVELPGQVNVTPRCLPRMRPGDVISLTGPSGDCGP